MILSGLFQRFKGIDALCHLSRDMRRADPISLTKEGDV